MAWRMAKSLETLLAQINALAPGRDKSSDGGIGNAEHSARTSDHNPDVDGVVKARDFTNDPAHGMSSQALAEALVASRDPRIKYIISNRKICSGTQQGQPAWKWRDYTGVNPHNHHCHVSVKRDAAHYDSVVPWMFELGAPATVPVTTIEVAPVLHRGSTGPSVVRLQELLNVNNEHVVPDGSFGPATELAVKRFQVSRHIVSDGVVGRYTWDALKEKH